MLHRSASIVAVVTALAVRLISATTPNDGSFNPDDPTEQRRRLSRIGLPPIVGGVTMKSAKIGYRLTDTPGDVHVEYADNPNFRNFLTSQSKRTTSASDGTGSIQLWKLQPDTRYHYRLVVDGEVQRHPLGLDCSFRTFPPPFTRVEMAVFSDASNVAQNLAAPVYQHGRDALLALQIGDLDHSNPLTLETHRAMHRGLRDPFLQHGYDFATNILCNMGFAHVWDDHDYCADDSDKNCNPFSKSAALKAYDEYYPGYNRPNKNRGIWHKFTVSNMEVFMLDLRSQRDPNELPDNEFKSMLDGDNLNINDQKTWLLEGLRDSTATWKVVVSSVSANYEARSWHLDHWKSFQTEAAEIKDWIYKHDLQDSVVMLSGDLHTGGGVDDGRNNRWGVPELGVPHTNLAQGTFREPGVWSHGIRSGEGGQSGLGYVVVDGNRLTLQAKNKNGQVLYSITLTTRSPQPQLARVGRCTQRSPCGACEGRCFSDRSCRGNLRCFKRGRGSFEAVPGCSGRGAAGMDYCSEDPNAAPICISESDPRFDVGYGGCSTYAEGKDNHEFCRQDGAIGACAECGSTFRSPHGTCFSYGKGKSNHDFCSEDRDPRTGVLAIDACPQCGLCVNA